MRVGRVLRVSKLIQVVRRYCASSEKTYRLRDANCARRRERNAVWRCKKSGRGKIRSEKEWQRCRTTPGVNGAFRCFIINSRTELNATPILLCSRTTRFFFSVSLYHTLLSISRQLENSVVVARGERRRRGGRLYL